MKRTAREALDADAGGDGEDERIGEIRRGRHRGLAHLLRLHREDERVHARELGTGLVDGGHAELGDELQARHGIELITLLPREGREEIRPVMNGLGVAIVSTSRGVMTDRRARETGVGGEGLCIVV